MPHSVIAQPWEDYAACRDVDREVFFARGRKAIARAKAVCAACPSAQCLEYVMATEPPDRRAGVWGGLNVTERKLLADSGDREERRGQRRTGEVTALA